MKRYVKKNTHRQTDRQTYTYTIKNCITSMKWNEKTGSEVSWVTHRVSVRVWQWERAKSMKKSVHFFIVVFYFPKNICVHFNENPQALFVYIIIKQKKIKILKKFVEN